MRPLFASLLLVTIASTTGCGETEYSGTTAPPERPRPGVLGKDGKVAFEYHSSKRACEFACAMMVGTQETIHFDPLQPPDIVVASSAPAVVTVGEGTSKIIHDGITEASGFGVAAKGAGTAEIVLRRSDGVVIERIDMRVEVPSRIDFLGESKTVRVGEQVSFTAAAIGSDGTRLEAFTGWDFSAETRTAGQVIDGCGLACFGSADFFHVKGVAPGTVTAIAKGGGTTATLKVVVVD